MFIHLVARTAAYTAKGVCRDGNVPVCDVPAEVVFGRLSVTSAECALPAQGCKQLIWLNSICAQALIHDHVSSSKDTDSFPLPGFCSEVLLLIDHLVGPWRADK